MNRTSLLGLGMALLLVAGAFLVMQRTGPASSAPEPEPVDVTREASPEASDLPAPTADTGNPRLVQVWKSATCGCCGQWIEHLRAAGFDVEAHDVANLPSVKDRYGVPPSLRACHTALVDGYLVEGHVPAEDLERLLDERPQVAGLAVPGMPVGSPGMEMGDRTEPYDVLTFAGDGTTTVYSSH